MRENSHSGSVESAPDVYADSGRFAHDSRKANNAPGRDAGHHLRQRDCHERLEPGGAEVEGRLLLRHVETVEPDGDDQGDYRQHPDEMHEHRRLPRRTDAHADMVTSAASPSTDCGKKIGSSNAFWNTLRPLHW